MSKGFLWFAQNNDKTDYAKLSIELAKSIKKYNIENSICVVADNQTKIKSEYIDSVIVLKEDNSKTDLLKFSNEYKAFNLTPFTHTIKLEADMLFTSSTDEWWNHLGQHDMIFSIGCRNYKDIVIKKSPYRKLFDKNLLPNVYNGLFYFRKSVLSKKFFDLCKLITLNWSTVKDELLINCHDIVPTTDVVYALALRIMDPTGQLLIDYPWFKFIHSKPIINNSENVADQYNYLYPIKLNDRIYLGGNRLNRIWHYYQKNTTDLLNDRVF
jgi:hypothetical protein